MNACGLTDLLCVADCVSVSTNDALIKHSDLQSCAHTNGCYLPSATIPAQDCINANCATEAEPVRPRSPVEGTGRTAVLQPFRTPNHAPLSIPARVITQHG